jgi:ornithine cyclodeaminase
MRTGAVAGVGAREIADDATSAAVIGTGVIGRTATMALDAALDGLREIDVFDLDLGKSERFANELTADLNTVVRNTETAEAAVSDSDVVVVATAGLSPPTLEAAWLDDGTTVIPLGDVDLPMSAIADDGVYVDDCDNVSEFVDHADWQVTGDIVQAVEDGYWSFDEFTELSTLVAENKTASSSGISLLLAYGLPIEDVAWSNAVYQQAVEKDIGQVLTLFEEPHWV